MKILTVDVGGTHVKLLATGQKEAIKIPSGPKMTPKTMVAQVLQTTKNWKYEAISMGYPGPVAHNKPLLEPHNLGPGWVDFDYGKAFGHPFKMINDAAMQAFGGYEGGKMLFLGLGTGLGSAFITEGTLEPLELAHLPYRKGKTYEDYIGARGLARLGVDKWRKHVAVVVKLLQAALLADYVLLGGGNAKELDDVPEGARLGANENAFRGGFRLWDKKESENRPSLLPSAT